MNTNDTPQPNTTPDTGEERRAQVGYFVRNAQGSAAADTAADLVLRHAPELREWAAGELARRGYTGAAARLRNAPARPFGNIRPENITRGTHPPGAPVSGIAHDIELSRLMVAVGVPLAVVHTYWAAAAIVRANERAGGRVKLDELRHALHRIGLHPAARTLDNWLKRGEGELWRVHGRGQRRVLYIRGHRRLCEHFTRRAARERPAAVETNLPGKLWAIVEFDGSPLDAAAMLGKLWAAWYGAHDRTHRISHATERDLWNRTRHQLDEARRTVNAVRRGGYVEHAHGLPPAHAFPKGYRHENGQRVILPTTWAANAYAVTPAQVHRRSKRSGHSAFAKSADILTDVLDTLGAQGHTALVINGTPARERVLMARRYFEHKSYVENVKAAQRAIARGRADRARVKVGEAAPRRYSANVEVYEQLEVSADGSECVPCMPPVRPHTRARHERAMLTRNEEDTLFTAHGGRAAIVESYAAPHGESVPRRRMGGVCA